MERWEEMLESIMLPSENQQTYIWGAGNTAVLAHQGMQRENLYTAFRVVGYIDKKHGGTRNGYPVYASEILNSLPRESVFVLICTANQWMLREIEAVLSEKGIAHCLLDAAIIKVRQAEFQKVSNLLDSRSRQVYLRLLEQRMTLDDIEPEFYGGDAYFGIPEFCRANPSDVIMDCGAYVGDSAERFVWRMEQFRKYIAIEPDLSNYNAMTKRFARLREEWNFPAEKLIALYGGVDETNRFTNLDSRIGGLGSIATDAFGETPFWTIDDLVRKQFSEAPPTFIKADIESFEYRMLLGARETLLKHRPRLAICIYHNAVDYYSIPLLIQSINPTYRFAVRHHSYVQAETVLYAY